MKQREAELLMQFEARLDLDICLTKDTLMSIDRYVPLTVSKARLVAAACARREIGCSPFPFSVKNLQFYATTQENGLSGQQQEERMQVTERQ